MWERSLFRCEEENRERSAAATPEESFDVECCEMSIPLNGEKWAAKSEAYAELIAAHLDSHTTWLDAGCGWRLLEDDMDPLEDWLVARCGRLIGMDLAVTTHRNIQTLVRGSLYALPFAAGSADLVTSNMVLEHLDDPRRAFAEVARCLRRGGAYVVKTPNLTNYGVFSNAVAAKLMPQKLRLRMVQGTDGRAAEDFFPVWYRANTMRRLTGLLEQTGFEIHKAIELPQQRPFLRRAEKVEKLLMKLTPVAGLLVCAHKRA